MWRRYRPGLTLPSNPKIRLPNALIVPMYCLADPTVLKAFPFLSTRSKELDTHHRSGGDGPRSLRDRDPNASKLSWPATTSLSLGGYIRRIGGPTRRLPDSGKPSSLG